MEEFFVKFVLPQSYSWDSLLVNAADLNFAKYVTLAAWLVFWVSLLFFRRRDDGFRPVGAGELGKNFRRSAWWIIAGHVFVYSLFWTKIGGINIPGLEVSLYPAAVVVGVVFLVSGLYFAVAGRYYLGSGWAVFSIIPPASGIVKSGPYKYSRHPIYFGFLSMWLGASLIFFNWSGLFLLFAFLLPLIYSRAKEEEAVFLTAFGGEYEDYKNLSGFLFPKLF